MLLPGKGQGPNRIVRVEGVVFLFVSVPGTFAPTPVCASVGGKGGLVAESLGVFPFGFSNRLVLDAARFGRDACDIGLPASPSLLAKAKCDFCRTFPREKA